MTYFTLFAVFSSCPGSFYLRCVVGIPWNVARVDDIVFVPTFWLLNTHVNIAPSDDRQRNNIISWLSLYSDEVW